MNVERDGAIFIFKDKEFHITKQDQESRNNKPNAAGVPRCLLKNLTSDLEKWVKVTGNVNLPEIFYRYIFGINLRSLRDFVIELTRSQDFQKKWPVTLTLRSRSPESKLVRDQL